MVKRRPDLSGIPAEVLKNTLGSGVGVGVCGPGSLIEEVQKFVPALPSIEWNRVGEDGHACGKILVIVAVVFQKETTPNLVCIKTTNIHPC